MSCEITTATTNPSPVKHTLSLLATLRLAALGSLQAADAPKPSAAEAPMTFSIKTDAQMDSAWNALWGKFFHEKTNLIYDFLTDHPTDPLCGYLPTPEEIKRDYPNPFGWQTGMENSALQGGPMLLACLYRYEATRDERIIEKIHRLYLGLKSLCEVTGIPGMVVRSIPPTDNQSYYTNSSRDQYTLLVHALYEFHQSSVSTPKQKKEIAKILRDIAVYVEKCAIPENDYKLLRADGKPAVVCEMWAEPLEKLSPHEVLRMPMFYSAAYAVTGERAWLDKSQHYGRLALNVAEKITQKKNIMGYELEQMQCSQYVLWKVEEEPRLKQRYLELMQLTAEYAATKTISNCEERLARIHQDVHAVPQDWRKRPFVDLFKGKLIYGKAYSIPWMHPSAFDSMFTVHELGRVLWIQTLCPDFKIRAESFKYYEEKLTIIDFDRYKLEGHPVLLAGYWQYRLLHPNPTLSPVSAKRTELPAQLPVSSRSDPK